MISAGAAEETHTITFDVRGIGETPDPVTVKDGESYIYLDDRDENGPKADGYVFHCWVTTLDFERDEVAMSNTAAYLETPITEDITLYAVWYKLIDSVEISVEPPVPGEVIGTDDYITEDYSFSYQSPHPKAEVLSEGARVQESTWTGTGLTAFWLEEPEDIESVFKGTFESGREYGVTMWVEPLFGYQFSDHLAVTFNGKELDEPVTADHNLCVVTVPISCGEETTPSESNPYAVNTGYHAYFIFAFAGILLAVLMFFILRKRGKRDQII